MTLLAPAIKNAISRRAAARGDTLAVLMRLYAVVWSEQEVCFRENPCGEVLILDMTGSVQPGLRNTRRAKRKFAIGQYTLVVRRSRAGRGLFTADPIGKGRCIVEYTGRALSLAEMYVSKSKYLFAISATKTIDGWEKTNVARYINHSCRPNCEIEISWGRIYVMAKRAIIPDEELFYDYDTEYFDAHIKPKGCKCAKCSPEKS